MEQTITGLHHITAIAGDPRRNLDFYTGVLGLRLVKKTVNFDDPDSYHLYYGDSAGNPGTILTFFPWPGIFPGKPGAGQANGASLSIPKQALSYWLTRLSENGVVVEEPFERFGEQVAAFSDPDGLRLEFVAVDVEPARIAVPGSAIPLENAIHGLHSTCIALGETGPTVSLLTEQLGFREAGAAGGRTRFECGAGGPGTYLDVIADPSLPPGRVAGGSVHHIAWRTPDEAAQLAWRRNLAANGVGVTKVQDRCYFNSIYFQEPGGVLFEIATDPPGFMVDETFERLGSALQLPVWLEASRERIAAMLPELR